MPVLQSANLLKTNSNVPSFDYIIVGAGSAGSVIARRLIDATDASVLLIEAGGRGDGIESLTNPTRWIENIGASHDWAYRYEGTPCVNDRILPLSRGKVAGGSGQTNALVWARGHRADFDHWASAGNEGWDYNSLLPFFKKSESWEDGESQYRAEPVQSTSSGRMTCILLPVP